ncbi:MAG TPA: MASE1 domain-containing protein, partial [Candidatus Paceibacterota bacterium]
MTRQSFLRYSKQYFQRFGPGTGLFFVYLIIGRIELIIHPIAAFATLLWLPAGIALAALVVYGYRLWPAIVLAAFAVYFSAGVGFLASLGIALESTLEVLAGVYFLRRYVGFKPTLLRLRDNTGLIAVALVAPMISAAIGVASLWLGG